MRISENHLTQVVLGGHDVNAELVKLRRFYCNSLSQHGQAFARFETAVMPQSQSARQMRSDSPTCRLLHCFEHLQLAQPQLGSRDRFGKQRLAVDSATNDDTIECL